MSTKSRSLSLAWALNDYYIKNSFKLLKYSLLKLNTHCLNTLDISARNYSSSDHQAFQNLTMNIQFKGFHQILNNRVAIYSGLCDEEITVSSYW